jgi:hypothetical protein
MSPDQTARAARFVRGFFHFLEDRNVRAAILHGGEDGFEHDLSDVDFVIDPSEFGNLPTLINDYCARSGWQLCQILRHETTAEFCICSAKDDPACAVALDACSDYQRNDTFYLAAAELLENRTPLPWGGHGISPAAELCYRFAKAAAKNKDAEACAAEFARYPETARRDCAAWLTARWGHAPSSWDASGLAPALASLGKTSNRHPSLIHKGTLSRIISRILRPTGLIVITGRDEIITTRLVSTFGHLYFRRCRGTNRWSPSFLKDLIASTLIVIPGLTFPWRLIIPPNCIYRLHTSQNPDIQCRDLATHLHRRCLERENL